MFNFERREQGPIQTGGGFGGSLELPFDSKFHFHGKFWINLINLGLFSLYFSSISPFYYL